MVLRLVAITPDRNSYKEYMDISDSMDVKKQPLFRRLKNDVEANKNLMGLLNEVGRNCEFFVTGDIEFDELHVLITEMKLESFNYNNRNNPGFNNVLFGI